ncbi:Arc family DNA-binding protein [Pseudomonas monteilii]|uniref:Arc family DNA-binding protein n=1 Tax=Pseudomonas TaxID=286 RepID=UPI001F43E64E|nr:Arc family DNA-binding protein [Pseudomonas juntendi]
MSDRHILPPYSLRLPQELRARLEKAAEISRRSLNAEMVARLEDSFTPSPSITLPAMTLSASPDLIEATRQQLRALIAQAGQLLDGLDALEKPS